MHVFAAEAVRGVRGPIRASPARWTSHPSRNTRAPARQGSFCGPRKRFAPANQSPTQASCAETMTGDRKATLTRRASKDVAQFAPNFTVYVLPPDVVCLYSDDRKFFLHGELYCALATAIGKGGKSLQQLVRELGKHFPPDRIEEALKRLIERRYIVEASPSSGSAVAGYWASLGLRPG